METNRDYETLCRDLLDIVEEQSDAVSAIIRDMFGQNEAPVEDWPDEDRYLLRDLDWVAQGLNQAVRLLDDAEREFRQESYRLRFFSKQTSE